MSHDQIYDITIIGAGPVGLFAAFYAGLREMKTKIIETMDQPGGQLTALYPEKYIYDVPGFVKITAKELVQRLMEQALQFNPTFHFNEQAVALNYKNDQIIEILTNKSTHLTKTLLICAGIGAFVPNKLNVPGALRFEGRGVFYSVKQKEDFRGKKLLIVGGGDSAVDWALNLKDIAEKITLIHRRDVFRAHEKSVEELFKSGIEIRLFTELGEIKGDTWVREAIVFDNRTKATTRLPVDAILIFIGYKADLGPLKTWGLQMDEKGIKVNANMETNLPRVFAAGDVASPIDGVKYNLLAVGFGQAAIAINRAKKIIDPKASTFEHSSSKTILTTPSSSPI
jgi:thioredoxin reductase (NADPH)